MTTIDQKIVEEVQKSLEVNGWPLGNLLLIVVALLLCVALCGFIGYEREKRGRSAGLRTHLLVGVGSCIIMILSIYGFPASQDMHRDVARLAAGVLAGVGFLGAGAIIHDKGSVKGLTTAGTIWLVMALGLACGSFNFVLAILATFVVMIVLIGFRKVEAKINKHAPIITIAAKADIPVVSLLLEYAKKNQYRIYDISSELGHNGKEDISLTTFKISSLVEENVDLAKVEDELTKITKAASVTSLNQH